MLPQSQEQQSSKDTALFALTSFWEQSPARWIHLYNPSLKTTGLTYPASLTTILLSNAFERCYVSNALTHIGVRAIFFENNLTVVALLVFVCCTIQFSILIVSNIPYPLFLVVMEQCHWWRWSHCRWWLQHQSSNHQCCLMTGMGRSSFIIHRPHRSQRHRLAVVCHHWHCLFISAPSYPR